MELFYHNEHRYIWKKKGKACEPENNTYCYFAPDGTVVLHKIDGIKNKEYYGETLTPLARKLKFVSMANESWPEACCQTIYKVE